MAALDGPGTERDLTKREVLLNGEKMGPDSFFL